MDLMHVIRMLAASTRGAIVRAVLMIISGGKISIGQKFKAYALPRFAYVSGSIALGNRVSVGRIFVSVAPEARLSIGHGTSINDYTFLVAKYGIEIGDNVLIAELVSIRDFDHVLPRIDDEKVGGFRGAPISIGSNVWVGRGAAILKGVNIGNGAIVGANAVVTRDVPANSVVVGVPARFIKHRDASGELGPDGCQT